MEAVENSGFKVLYAPIHTGIVIRADNFNDLFLWTIEEIKAVGRWTHPRGFDCKEVLGSVLILENPRKCLVTIGDRKLNYAYLTIEKLMYLSKFQDPETLIAYNHRMQNYLNPETGFFDGAYGPRVDTQFEWCYSELMNDIDSRRAVVTIHDKTDCNSETKDSACTLSWQFMVRDGKLDMHVNMRSNDILWGLCLDVPAFCFAQEVMAYWLKIPMGRYFHHAASLHYYKEYEEQLLGYVKYKTPENHESIPKWDVSFECTRDALNWFWRQEKLLRKNGTYNLSNYDVINRYLERLKEYWDNKSKKINGN